MPLPGAWGVNETDIWSSAAGGSRPEVKEITVRLSKQQHKRLVEDAEIIRISLGGLFKTQKVFLQVGGGNKNNEDHIPSIINIELLGSRPDRQDFQILLTEEQLELIKETRIVITLPHIVVTSRVRVGKLA